MIIGVPQEIKNNENRVGLTPAGVAELRKHGHTVLVQAGAGGGSGFDDAEYEQAGAQLLATIAEVYEQAEMIVKVKEPIAEEYPLIKEAGIKFVTFFDVGNNFSVFPDGTNIPFTVRMDAGFGLRWFSPIGPLRFEWGFPFAKRDYEQSPVFSFFIGPPF